MSLESEIEQVTILVSIKACKPSDWNFWKKILSIDIDVTQVIPKNLGLDLGILS